MHGAALAYRRKGLRPIEVEAATVAVLRAQREAQDHHRRIMGDGYSDADGLVFPAEDGRPRRPGTLTWSFSSLVRATGLRRVTLHSLRHAHETLLLDNGVPLHVVAARMGHDPATMMKHYAHVGTGSQRLAAGLEALLDGERPALRAVPVEPRDDETPGADEEARRALP